MGSIYCGRKIQNLRRRAEAPARRAGLFQYSRKKIITVREPVGVYGVIVPWDYPILFSGSYCSPALAIGNTIILKPASYTPISSILLAECYEKAGVPKGILNVITGPGAKIGEALCKHPLVDAIGFTGETITGKRICELAGLKKVTLELGGTGPQIVLADANIPAAARAACDGAMLNAGQICSGTERVLIHNSVKDEFIEESIKYIKSIKIGDPLEGDTFMGPLNNEDVIKKVEKHIEDAIKKGAKVVFGGHRIKGLSSDLFFEPTIIDGVLPGMLVHDEETYGPVIPITVFDTDEEAVKLANSNGYGLQMAVFTSDIRKMEYYSKKLKTGGININDGTIYDEEHIGFGGAPGTKSGHGKLGGRAGLEEMSHVKVIYVDLNNLK